MISCVETVADVQFAELSLPSVGKAFTECFIAFTEYFRYSAKQLILVVIVS
jgi:hypothetical protein